MKIKGQVRRCSYRESKNADLNYETKPLLVRYC